uniref:Secreted protein n=1 Tax=Romanomermis culicivorax TaxID=13658 RepID=A0A915J253_ROMCU
MCIITGGIIVVLAVTCFVHYKRRASRRRIEYLTGQSSSRMSGDRSFERRAMLSSAKKCGNIDDGNGSATRTKLSRIRSGKKSSAKTQSSIRVAVAASSSRRPETKHMR